VAITKVSPLAPLRGRTATPRIEIEVLWLDHAVHCNVAVFIVITRGHVRALC
jgi:hypothetical protein